MQRMMSAGSTEWKNALCYYSDGRFDEAEAFFREVMYLRTNVLGAEHSDTLKVVGFGLPCTESVPRGQSTWIEGDGTSEKNPRRRGSRDTLYHESL